MGVDVPFDDLGPIEYVGSTFERHCEVVSGIEDRVVAIDASQWVFQAYQGARSREAQNVLAFPEAIRLSAITLIMDRVTQILRYGGHPVVVLDGPPPMEKAHAAQWTGEGRFQIHGVVEQLCKAMVMDCRCIAELTKSVVVVDTVLSPSILDISKGVDHACSFDIHGVCCVRAPSEGEAFCAALNECRIADVCFTTDVIDVFFFGARKVMRPIAKGEQTKAKFLTYQDPPGSSYAVVNSSTMISYVGDVVRKEHLKDVVLFFAAVIGTDYNSKGVPRYGKEKAKAVTRLMYNHWRSLCDSGHEDRGFIEYSVRVVCGQVDVDSSDKLFKTFLKACAEETRPGCTFARDLRMVVHVVQDQRARACERAQGLQRAHVMWSGNRVDHQNLISILKKAKVEEEQENGVNGVLSRIMKLEAERMLRFGECSVSKPLIRIESIAKPKEVKKWTDEKGHDGSSAFYQYLVNLTTHPDCDIADSKAKAVLVDYAKTEKTWIAGARAARASAIRAKWPSVLIAYIDKCAAKQQKPVKAPKSSKGGRGKDAGNTDPRKAGTAGAWPQDMRTSLGTYHIRSFLESDAAPTKAVLDVIAAHQSTGATCAKQKVEDDAEQTIDGKEEGGIKPNRRSKDADVVDAVAATSNMRQAHPCDVHKTPGSPCVNLHSSQHSQCTNLFSSMPDVISKQPNVCFRGSTGSNSPARGLRQCSPPLSPEKRDRPCVPEDSVGSLTAHRVLLSTAAAIDLTLSSDDDVPFATGQCSQDVRQHMSDNISDLATPKKRRSNSQSASPPCSTA